MDALLCEYYQRLAERAAEVSQEWADDSTSAGAVDLAADWQRDAESWRRHATEWTERAERARNGEVVR